MTGKTAALLCALFMLVQSAAAQNYPVKPVTVILPLAAGGPGDVMARYLAQAMQKTLKQPLVIENVGGAGGNIGTARAAKAAPDGYTLLLHHIGMATNPALYRSLQYNPLTDFEYIGLVADVPLMILARGDLAAANLKELASLLRSSRNKLTYAHAGVGSASHLCGLRFFSAIEAEVVTVPYKGTGPAMNDLLGGRVDMLCDAQTPSSAGQIQGGKVKVIGVTSRTRISSLPNIPTLDEQGLKGFEMTVWRGLYAPKGTPKSVVDRLVSSLQEAVRDPEFRAQLAKLGTEPVAESAATPEALRSFLKSEIDKWGTVIRRTGQFLD